MNSLWNQVILIFEEFNICCREGENGGNGEEIRGRNKGGETAGNWEVEGGFECHGEGDGSGEEQGEEYWRGETEGGGEEVEGTGGEKGSWEC